MSKYLKKLKFKKFIKAWCSSFKIVETKHITMVFGTFCKHLSDEGFYTIRFLNDSIAYAAGKGRISILTFRE